MQRTEKYNIRLYAYRRPISSRQFKNYNIHFQIENSRPHMCVSSESILQNSN